MTGEAADLSIEISSFRHRWPSSNRDILEIESLDLSRGEKLLLRGPSGSGKSTLLSALAGVIDIPPDQMRVSGQDIGRLRGAARDRFRADAIGVIFQMFNLLPWLNPIDNVLLSCRFSRLRRDRAGPNPIATARRLLNELGLGDQALQSAPAIALSVGQQQRVAAARALIGAPDLILADEPTSALDGETRDSFIDLLIRECAQVGASLLFVSHDRNLDRHFDRVLDMTEINRAYRAC